MTDRLRIALAQLNPKVGALRRNLALAKGALRDAEAAGADILMLSELFLTGYFPEDLFFKPRFIEDAMAAAAELVARPAARDVSAAAADRLARGPQLYNAVLLAENGRVVGTALQARAAQRRRVLREALFHAGAAAGADHDQGRRRSACRSARTSGIRPVCEYLVGQGAEMLLCPNGSPYWNNKQHTRLELVRARVAEDGVPLLYLNQVGGQDELVFDGASFGMEPGGKLVFQAKSFESDFVISDWERTKRRLALHQGRGDAAGFGVRSAVAGDAARPARLRPQERLQQSRARACRAASTAPSSRPSPPTHSGRRTSTRSCCPTATRPRTACATPRTCAARLGVRYDIVPIGRPVDEALHELAPVFGNAAEDVTEENIQSRMRGLILMAVSNKTGAMLLTTGNKSEMAVGYATIYGDMNGGFNPIKDLFKMEVYKLAAGATRTCRRARSARMAM